MAADKLGRVALVYRGSREDRARGPTQAGRLGAIGAAMAEVGLVAESAVYLDAMVDDVRRQLLEVDGLLVWVDPLTADGDRSQLDPLLRELASRGLWVSAHPDVILKMGTKEVLVTTKSLGWGTDCHLYRTREELRTELPRRLATGATRVLKQYRGNGGNGVYRVALQVPPAQAERVDVPGEDAIVHTQHALRGSSPKDMTLGDFMDRIAKHFAGDGRLIDQPFQARLADGMVRAYMTQGEVVGFGVQLIKALLPPPPEGLDSPAAQPGPRVMHGADYPQLRRLRQQLETEWIPGLQQLLAISTGQLPAIWDADFLYGPKTAAGEDTYVLCEINVSAVFPFPDHALPTLAKAAATAIAAAKQARARRAST